MRREDGVLHVAIEDDGDGFGQSMNFVDDLPALRGWGLRLLLEQILQESGHMLVTSELGEGSRIDLSLLISVEQASLSA